METIDLDALVAAPAQHRLALENERVRVLDTKVAPGEVVPVHTHRWSAVLYVLGWSDFIRREASGKVMLDTAAAGIVFQPGQAIWSGPLEEHTLENVGDSMLHILAVELKD